MNLNNSLHFSVQVNPDYKCPICFDIMKVSFQTVPCGHNICGNCKTKLKPDHNIKCPICKTVCAFYKDARFEREINTSKIQCNFCQKNLQLNEIETHLENHCLSFFTKCKNCEESVLYKDLQNHFNSICKKVAIQCPNCPEFLLKQHIEIHAKYYCESSLERLFVNCEICLKKVPLTSMQNHYFTHVKRSESIYKKPILKINIL